MNEKIVAIDIETENTGIDIMNDNTRIISVQLHDGTKGEFYYANSTTSNLKVAKEKIKGLLNNGVQFVGYNILRFDIPILKKFLDIEIPLSQVIDISEMKSIFFLKKELNKGGISLEEACKHFGIKCEHKKLLEPIAEKIRQYPEVIAKSESEGLKLASKTGWGVERCRSNALKKISGGMAILEMYNEFVRSNGSIDSLFYKYAMGDAISEYELYYKLKTN